MVTSAVLRLMRARTFCYCLLGIGVPLTACFAQTSEAADSKYTLNIRFASAGEHKAVPFEFSHGVILFKARVDGREVWAVLDNGAAYTAVDTTFAESNGLNVGPAIGRLSTPTGTLIVRSVSGGPIEIPGQFSFQRSPLLGLDLSSVSKALGRPVVLQLGADLFDRLLFVIYPSTRSFDVGQAGSLRPPPNMPHLDLKPDRPQVTISVGGRLAVVTVDLGYGGTIALDEATWSRLGLAALPTTADTTTGAEGIVTPIKTAVLDEVSVGSIKVHKVPISTTPPLHGNGDGLIGMGFFARFSSAIDMGAHRIWLIPLAGANSR